ncbi:putative dehydrogenase [Dongia mobilis]|uniref:Putative dehydrogenase n=1 Tax=Dongia mobilis TaxID=578943 RepID=A0A4R6WT78_9PROT|nr:Gfo/Idh/MocA family oxidoreductase [Dongia mobilis]TDQ86429.1 putative dehydrogenase [Dongia mobilis]
MQPVKWGIVSTADIGLKKVIPAMLRGRNIEIAAIASRDLPRAQAAAGRLGIPRAYGSYEELLADPAIEAIYNPLPNHLHVPVTLLALAAGKHVLCEKPIALDAAEAALLTEAAAKAGKLVAEAFMVRFHPQWQRAREMVRAGVLGEVRLVSSVFTYYLDDPNNVRNMAEIGGGGLYDIGCYPIVTARYLFGAEPVRVTAAMDRDPRFKTDRLTSAIAEFPPDASGAGRHLVFGCATQLVPRQHVQILGTKARAEVMIPFNAPPNQPTIIRIDDGTDLSGANIRAETIPACDQYTLQGEVFSDAVRGKATLEFGIADAILNMRVIDAMFRAAQHGSWEKP